MSLSGLTSVSMSQAAAVAAQKPSSPPTQDHASGQVKPVSKDEFLSLMKQEQAKPASVPRFAKPPKSPAAQLREAAIAGDIDKIRQVKAQNPKLDVDAVDSLEQTAMHHAAMAGQDDAIEALKALGASVHSKDSYERTPLHYAAAEGKVSTIRKLAELGANLEARERYGGTAMHEAAARNQTEAIQTLLALNADVFAEDNDGRIPLHEAVANRHLEATEVLAKHQSKTLKNKESIETEDKFGKTPSDGAVRQLKEPDLDPYAKRRLQTIDDVLYMYRHPGYMRLKASDFSDMPLASAKKTGQKQGL